MTLSGALSRFDSIDDVAGYWLAVSPVFTLAHVEVLAAAGIWGDEQQRWVGTDDLFEPADVAGGVRVLRAEVRAELTQRFVDPLAVDARTRAIHHDLAVRLADDGGDSEIISALFHARRSEAWPVLVDLWGRHGLGLIARADAVAFDAYSRLPLSVLEAYPFLTMAAVIFDRAVHEADGPARRAVIEAASARAAGLLSSDLSEWSANAALNVMVGAMISERTRGRTDRAAQIAERVEVEITERGRSAAGVDAPIAAWSHLQCGLTYLLVSRIDRARLSTAAAHRAARLAGIDGEHIVVNAASQLALIEAVGGSPAEAERWMADAAGRRCHPWFDLPVRAPALVALALLDAERMTTSPSSVSIDDLAGAELEIWPFVQLALARRRIRRGAPIVALSELDAAVARQAMGEQAAVPPLALAVARSEALVALGRHVQALQTIVRAAARAGVDAASHSLLSLPYARAQVYRGGTTRDAAAAILTQPEGFPLVDQVEAQILTMRTALVAGDHAEAERVGREVDLVIVRNRLWWLSANVPLAIGASERDPESLRAVAAAVPYPQPASPDTLSKRERVVLARLVESTSIDEIARALVVSPNTVKSQLRSIYRKLGVNSRDGALAEMQRRGLGHG
ncbi:helix-turn-helix transcriptional regulator [Agromyces atrinae]|uniref:helix-turn-helix transcriptional regulator n=1 Tax=Agromyces atrinae TaxID=592376 RepID=UPI001F5A1576|nr:helix-turn-helix transcriptional regulator [Agromyces atrinae]MCI2956475.1 helix-turn-helix transcriptional regulator [Agromyces atrinae]